MSVSIAQYRLYAALQSQPIELERLGDERTRVDRAATLLTAAQRVVTIGIGTSWNAASVAAWMLSAAGADARAWSSHDFVSYPPALDEYDAAVVFTHTGRKRYSRAAIGVLHERGVPIVLVTSTESDLNEGDLPHGTIVLPTVAREPSSMFTVSHTAAMFTAALVADAMRAGCIGDPGLVPGAVEDALALEPRVQGLAEEWHGRGAIVALGAGPREASAYEAHIKIAEAARRAVRSYAVEQFLHGPQVQLDPAESVLAFAGSGTTLERTLDAAGFAQRLGCSVAWVAPAAPPIEAAWLPVADVGDLLAPIVEAIPSQLLAGHLASLAGVDGDSFRRDDPRFAAAHEPIVL